MNSKILEIISGFSEASISPERKEILQSLTDYIKTKKDKSESIRLNFICTHNSRRSHLSQIWAQTMAYHFKVPQVFCFSGGTEATALFPKVAETLSHQGFTINTISANPNPVYSIKYANNEISIVCFSKKYDDAFNPESNYAAIITCNSADENCPVVFGAEARIPIKYNDPKEFDGTALMDIKYAERSLEIAQELWYVFMSVSN